MRVKVDEFLYLYFRVDEVIRDKRRLIFEAKKAIKDIAGDIGISALNNDGMPKSLNSGSDGILNAILARDRQIEKLQAQMTEYEKDILIHLQIKTTIGKVYDGLNEVERAILRGRYKYYRDNTMISQQTGVSLRTIDRKIKAIRTKTAEAIRKDILENDCEEKKVG